MNPVPPSAKPVPSERTQHGDIVIDEYTWLTDPKDPETIAYLEAENAYTESLTEGLAGLRASVFGEIKARTQETDLSVPHRKGGYWHYGRTVEGQQYPLYCRRAVRPGEVTPPLPVDGQPLDGEEVLLDGNALAEDSNFFSIGTYSVSPRRPAACLLDRFSPVTSGTRCGLRTWQPASRAPTRFPARSTAAPGHWTPRRCST